MNDAASARSRPGRYYLLILAALAAMVLTVLATRFLGSEAAHFWLAEGGIIETLSPVGYGICILLMIVLGGKNFALRYANLIVLLLFLCARELDFDKRFTTDGIFKTSFYVSSEVPLMEKLAAVAVILVLGWAVLKFAFEHLDHVTAALLRFHPAALSGALALACMVASKTFDGIARKLIPWGVEVSEYLSLLLTDVEEVLELGIPVFFIIAAIAYFGTRSDPVARDAGR